MISQPTPEQERDFETAVKIGGILASTVGTMDSPRIRVNPHTLKEAVGIYHTLGAKKPFLQGNEQFVMNCLLYSAETFAACSHRVVLCHLPYRSQCRLLVWQRQSEGSRASRQREILCR
jgi:hypothetical protein